MQKTIFCHDTIVQDVFVIFVRIW